MASLIVNLADSVMERAQTQAAEAGFASVDEYIANLIQSAEGAVCDDLLETELLRGLDSGPAVMLTPETLNQIKRDARQG